MADSGGHDRGATKVVERDADGPLEVSNHDLVVWAQGIGPSSGARLAIDVGARVYIAPQVMLAADADHYEDFIDDVLCASISLESEGDFDVVLCPLASRNHAGEDEMREYLDDYDENYRSVTLPFDVKVVGPGNIRSLEVRRYADALIRHDMLLTRCRVDGTLSVVDSKLQGAGPVGQFELTGCGRIEIRRGALVGPHGDSPPQGVDDDRPTIVIEDGQVIESSGSLVVSFPSGPSGVRTVYGRHLAPPYISIIDWAGAAEAELLWFDPSAFELTDLGRLRGLARALPAIGSGTRRAAEEHLRHRRASLGPVTQSERISRWWMEIRTLATHNGADGSTLSIVRYEECRARLQASVERRRASNRIFPDREHLVLRLWSIIGFGERVGRAFALWIGVTLILAAVSQRMERRDGLFWASPLRTFGALLASPIAAVRVNYFQNVPGTSLDLVLFTSSQIFGGIIVATLALVVARSARAARV